MEISDMMVETMRKMMTKRRSQMMKMINSQMRKKKPKSARPEKM